MIQDCLGVLDGTYIKVNVLFRDQGRYKNRKNEIVTNVLGVCSRDMRFKLDCLDGKGSAANNRVLRYVFKLRSDRPVRSVEPKTGQASGLSQPSKSENSKIGQSRSKPVFDRI